MFGYATRCNRGFVDDSFLLQSPLRGQFAELRQLQEEMMIFGFCFSWRSFLLKLGNIAATLDMQLLLTFRVLRLHTCVDTCVDVDGKV